MSLAVAAISRCKLLLRAAGRRTEPPFTSHAFEIVSARLLPAIERRWARAGGRRRRRDEWPPTVRLAAGAHRLPPAPASQVHNLLLLESKGQGCSARPARSPARWQLPPSCPVARAARPNSGFIDFQRAPPTASAARQTHCLTKCRDGSQPPQHRDYRPPSSSYAAPSAPLLASILSLSLSPAPRERAAWKGDLERQLMHIIAFSHTFN